MNELVEIRSEDNLKKRKYSESAMTKEIYSHLYDVVKQFMIHGPRGEQNMGSSCMNKNTQK